MPEAVQQLNLAKALSGLLAARPPDVASVPAETGNEPEPEQPRRPPLAGAHYGLRKTERPFWASRIDRLAAEPFASWPAHMGRAHPLLADGTVPKARQAAVARAGSEAVPSAFPRLEIGRALGITGTNGECLVRVPKARTGLTTAATRVTPLSGKLLGTRTVAGALVPRPAGQTPPAVKRPALDLGATDRPALDLAATEPADALVERSLVPAAGVVETLPAATPPQDAADGPQAPGLSQLTQAMLRTLATQARQGNVANHAPHGAPPRQVREGPIAAQARLSAPGPLASGTQNGGSAEGILKATGTLTAQRTGTAEEEASATTAEPEAPVHDPRQDDILPVRKKGLNLRARLR